MTQHMSAKSVLMPQAENTIKSVFRETDQVASITTHNSKIYRLKVGSF